jgi:hypothetical protein
MTDLVATGSSDGFVRLWSADANSASKGAGGDKDKKSGPATLKHAAAIAVGDGFANSIAMSQTLMVVGMGAEHRLGRWWHFKGNRNKVILVRFPNGPQNGNVPDEEGKEIDEDVEDDNDDEIDEIEDGTSVDSSSR